MSNLFLLSTSLRADTALAQLKKKWRSDVYKHFEEPKIVQGPHGIIIHRFVCKKYVAPTMLYSSF